MNMTNKCGFSILTILLLAGLFCSCLKESFDDCPRPFRLFVKAVDADQNDITNSGEVMRVILFVFDENGQIVDAIELNEEQVRSKQPVDIELDYPGHQSLSFIAWGNVDQSVEVLPYTSVKELSDLYLSLRATSSNNTTLPVAQTPCDLFYGSLNTPIEYGGIEPTGDHTVIISRKTTQVVISTYGLKKWNQNREGDYTFVLRESYNGCDQDGNFTGEMVKYNPQAQMDEKGDLFAPIFNAFPTTQGKSYTLEVLYEGEVIYSADKGSDGKPFTPETGRLLNIIIDFGTSISIKVVVTPWNEVFQHVNV